VSVCYFSYCSWIQSCSPTTRTHGIATSSSLVATQTDHITFDIIKVEKRHEQSLIAARKIEKATRRRAWCPFFVLINILLDERKVERSASFAYRLLAFASRRLLLSGVMKSSPVFILDKRFSFNGIGEKRAIEIRRRRRRRRNKISAINSHFTRRLESSASRR
jgi:hypothetical protein